MRILTDRQGIPIGCSEPMGGNHHASFKLEEKFDGMIAHLQKRASAPKDYS